jgi:signal peptidase I
VIPVCLVTGLLLSLLVLIRRGFVVVRIDGESMTPSYRPGQWVLLRRRKHRRVHVGEVVMFERPDDDGNWDQPATARLTARRWLIKRVAGIGGDPVPVGTANPQGSRTVPGECFVAFGDASRSFDSRHFGFVPTERIIGAVVWARAYRG